MAKFQIGQFDIADPAGEPVAVLGWRGDLLGIYQRTQPNHGDRGERASLEPVIEGLEEVLEAAGVEAGDAP